MFVLPLSVEAEFRGRKQSREFERDGQKFSSSEVLFFETENPQSGEPMHLKVRVNQLLRDGVAHDGIEKGDEVLIVGIVRCSEQGDDYGSQIVVSSLSRAGSPPPARAASNGAAAKA
jgi:hypothetical protein